MMLAKKEILIRKFRFAVIVIILFSVYMQAFAEQSDPNSQEDLFEMSIEELMDVEVNPIGGFTVTDDVAASLIDTISDHSISMVRGRIVEGIKEYEYQGRNIQAHQARSRLYE